MAKKSGNLIIVILAILFSLFLWLLKNPKDEKKLIPEAKSDKKNRTKIITFGLISLGLLFQIAGFFTDKADKNATLLKCFANDYVNAKEGYDTILQKEKLSQIENKSIIKKSLTPDDVGFAQLSEVGNELILNEVRRTSQISNSRMPSKLLITSIRTGSGLTVKGEHLGNLAFHCFEFCNQVDGFEVSTKEIEEKLENMKNDSLFKWAFIAFISGFIIQIVGLWFSQNN